MRSVLHLVLVGLILSSGVRAQTTAATAASPAAPAATPTPTPTSTATTAAATPTPTATPAAAAAATTTTAAAPATAKATPAATAAAPAATKATPAAAATNASATTAAANTTTAASNTTAKSTVNISGYPSPSTGAVAGNVSALLTTRTSPNGPTIFVDGSGDEVTFQGIGWYGFNIGLASLGNLSAGPNAVSNDFKQIVYRMRMLGFNSIRVAFAFDDTWGINSPVVDWTEKCLVPSQTAIMQSLLPSSQAKTTLKSNSDPLPPVLPPTVTDGICNNDWPQQSTYQRFIWVVDYLISEGFYVMLDFHSNRYGNAKAEGNESLYDQASWIQSWVALVKTVLLNTPAAHGKLLIDLINEPDGYALTWAQQGAVPSLGSYYLNTIDALYKVCPGCLFLIEGGGQSTYCGINWGDGFITDSSIISSLSLTSPASMFDEMLTKPWLSQVVLAPHIYCPAVSGATACFNGSSQWDALDKSFGYLTVAPGWCNGTDCHVFPVLLDEFGSTLDNQNETSCISSIIEYANGLANAKTHAPLTSWFWWAWQPDSAGTGGLVENNWYTLIWEKIGLLTGGTADFATGMALKPWYLTGFEDLTPQISLIQTNTTITNKTIALAPKAAVPTPAPIAAIAAAPDSEPGSPAATAQPTPSSTIAAGFINANNTVTSQATPVSSSGSPNSVSGVATYASTTNLNKASSGSKLSTGAIAGIVVGGVVLLALVVGGIVLAVKLRNPRIADSYTPTSAGSRTPISPQADSHL